MELGRETPGSQTVTPTLHPGGLRACCHVCKAGADPQDEAVGLASSSGPLLLNMATLLLTEPCRRATPLGAGHRVTFVSPEEGW